MHLDHYLDHYLHHLLYQDLDPTMVFATMRCAKDPYHADPTQTCL